ncbi:protein of unknown function [Chitinophaga sp. YR627]|uniref:DUF4421 family protein n=1 Tax=Chitinophaga sp. YR627 TaxID=1881041 RepID=UPI0008EA606F|nr:DUF4421 family protein [Chitinophaga sp. YR627]SFM57776.1 protein of unknown function [Chitinophaga sp. YR627]
MGRYYIVLIFLLGVRNMLPAQQHVDTNYIRSYERKNMLEVYTGIYNTEFSFTHRHDRRKNFRLKVNSSSYLGADISYKWLYLQYSFNVPGTQLDNRNKFNYKLIRFQFGNRRLSFQPFYNYYNGLLIPTTHRRDFEPFQGIAISNAGFDLYYTNSRRFSSSAASIFSEKQVSPAGAVFFSFTPVWQQIHWKKPSPQLVPDTMTFKLLSSNPEWISVLPGIGYSYNFVPHRGWIIAPAILLKLGVLNEIHPDNDGLQLLNDEQFWLNTGYSNERFYIYLNLAFERESSNLLLKDMTRVDMSASITAGMRFYSLKKKILRIL